MAVVVARVPIGVGTEMVLLGQLGVVGILGEIARFPWFPIGVVTAVARVHLIARPALRAQRAAVVRPIPARRTQVGIPLHAVVHAERGLMDEYNIVIPAFEPRKFQAAKNGIRGHVVPINIGRRVSPTRAAFLVGGNIVAARRQGEDKNRKNEEAENSVHFLILP